VAPVGPVWFQNIFVEYSEASHTVLAVSGWPAFETRRALPVLLSMQA
jgi:hypothetical protein